MADKQRSGQPKKFEDEELDILLNENPNRTIKELAESLDVSGFTVSRRLKAMGKWVANDPSTDSE